MKNHPVYLHGLNDPYDLFEREDINYYFDISYYNGKYYVYFGALPVLTLMIPYKLITGNYLTKEIIVLIYSIFASFFMVKTFIAMYKRWFSKIPFKILIIMLISLLMGSLTLWLCRRPLMYEIVIAAGFYFIMQGIFCLFKAIEKDKINYIYLTLCCISMACAVACRPILLFASLVLVPVLFKILKNNLKERKNVLKLILCVRNTVYINWNSLNAI